METIKCTGTSEKALCEALKGEYGTYAMQNGITVTKAGRLVQFWGPFDATAEAVEVPVLPERYPITFSGDDFSCGAVVEAGSGSVPVPALARGKRFFVFANCLLNT